MAQSVPQTILEISTPIEPKNVTTCLHQDEGLLIETYGGDLYSFVPSACILEAERRYIWDGTAYLIVNNMFGEGIVAKLEVFFSVVETFRYHTTLKLF